MQCGLNGGYCSEWDLSATSCNCYKVIGRSVHDDEISFLKLIDVANGNTARMQFIMRRGFGPELQPYLHSAEILSPDGKAMYFHAWSSDKVSLQKFVQVGEIFNPVGYALVMPRIPTFADHLAFNQVLQYLKERGDLDLIFERQLAMPNCASDVGVVAQVCLPLCHMAS